MRKRPIQNGARTVLFNDVLRPLPIFYAADETRVGFRLSKGGRYLSLPSDLLNKGDHSQPLPDEAPEGAPSDAEMQLMTGLLRQETEAHFGAERSAAWMDGAKSGRKSVRDFVDSQLTQYLAGRQAGQPLEEQDRLPAVAARSDAELTDRRERVKRDIAKVFGSEQGSDRPSDPGNVLVELFSRERVATRERRKSGLASFRREGLKALGQGSAAVVPVDFDEVRSERMNPEEASENAEAIRKVLSNLQGRARR